MTIPSPQPRSLSNFKSKQSKPALKPRIGIPRFPFRTRPARRIDNINLLLHNKLWWMVSQEVVERCKGPKILSGSLCEGVFENGRTIIIPVTDQYRQMPDWGDFLETALDEAQEEWVEIQTDYLTWCELNVPPIQTSPQWPGCTLEELILEAFDGQIIETVEQFEQMFPPSHYEPILEEDVLPLHS